MRHVICVGVITRGRPRGFSNLLTSLEKLQHPPDADVVFAFVENDDKATVETIVEKFQATFPDKQVFFEIEPRLGIPVARNRVLAIAFREGCDFLAFVDDDETVAEDWLTVLYSELRDRSLDLIGGPVRLQPCPTESNLIQRTVWRGLVRRNLRIESTAARRHGHNSDHRVTVVTSNWLARMAFIERAGIRFDESLGFSGGSDTRFFREAKKAGGRTGWAPGACVYEFMPTERLSIPYQYRRGRDQAIASYHNKYPQRTIASIVRSTGFMLVKTVSATALLLLSAFDRGTSLVAAVRAAGFAAGRAQAVFGGRSRQYENVQGA